MGELANYFGNDALKVFAANAQEKHAEFYKQSKATKGEMADTLMTKNGIYEQALHELVDTLEETAAKLDLKDKVIENMEKEYGVSDKEFIQKHQLQVVVCPEKNRAKKALLEHLAKKYPKGLVQATKAQKQ